MHAERDLLHKHHKRCYKTHYSLWASWVHGFILEDTHGAGVMARAMILVGIDKAGYGPILGPLVVSASAFELPAARADACPWKMRQRSTCRTTSVRESGIAIQDGKKLHHRKQGLARLERSVLSTIGA